MGGRGAASGAGAGAGPRNNAPKDDGKQRKIAEKTPPKESRKDTQEDKISKLKAAGGSEWESGDKHRVYFNDIREDFGLEIERRKSGSVSNAKLDGKSISNNKGGQIEETLSRAKVWYDVKTG